MPLIHRKQKVNATWALQATEAGALAAYGVELPRIAERMSITTQYVAILVQLYFGYKDYPELLKIANITDAQDMLRKLRQRTKELNHQ